MLARGLTLLTLVALSLAFASVQALAQDAQICFDAADKATDGNALEEK